MKLLTGKYITLFNTYRIGFDCTGRFFAFNLWQAIPHTNLKYRFRYNAENDTLTKIVR